MGVVAIAKWCFTIIRATQSVENVLIIEEKQKLMMYCTYLVYYIITYIIIFVLIL